MKPTDFDNWMIAGEKSTAYRLFCESVYQAGGCQYNMVAPDQRKALLAALPLTEDMTVLDAGWNEAEQALDDISSERRRRYLYLARIPD